MFELLVIVFRYFIAFFACLFVGGLIFYLKNKSKTSEIFMRSAILFFQFVCFFMLIHSGIVPQTETLIYSITVMAATAIFMRLLRKYDTAVVCSVLFLVSISIILLMRLDFELAKKQMLFAFFGFVLILLIPHVFNAFEKILSFHYMFAALGFLLILIVFVFGSEENGAKNWVSFYGFSFQPSEFIKVCLVLFSAGLFKIKTSLKRQIFAYFVTACFVISFALQKDFGAALIFFFTLIFIMLYSNGSIFMCLLAVAGSVSGLILVSKFYPSILAHVIPRIDGWLQPFKNADTSGYQLVLSLFAICTYGPFGIGLTRGLAFKIPYVKQDFIFAVVGEEFGFIFALCLIAIYALLIVGMITGFNENDSGFKRIAGFSSSAMLTVQALIIISANIGLLPITGVTLPFVSYGGSSLLSSCILAGIILWAKSQKEAKVVE